ncbi:MAG TPA: LytTR family transcriptional regulator [Bacteroidetes bacterium]|nr:LytTR family transcriptional regulator [Bacteroidota bacterium]
MELKLIKQPESNWKQRNKKLEEFLDNRLVISTTNYIHLLDLEDILYLKSVGNYTRIIMITGKEILCSKTLKHYEQLLSDKAFLRVHSSYLINLNKVIGIKRNGVYTIELHDGTMIPVSRGYKDNLFSKIF